MHKHWPQITLFHPCITVAILLFSGFSGAKIGAHLHSYTNWSVRTGYREASSLRGLDDATYIERHAKSGNGVHPWGMNGRFSRDFRRRLQSRRIYDKSKLKKRALQADDTNDTDFHMGDFINIIDPEPSKAPTPNPQPDSTPKPATQPAQNPTSIPTPRPTLKPTPMPTKEPTSEPTTEPTSEPTKEPTSEPTTEPTSEPTTEPTSEPTTEPTSEPTSQPTSEPTPQPTSEPTLEPTAAPTSEPTAAPSSEPTAAPSDSPTESPTPVPTTSPTAQPSLSLQPSYQPSAIPTSTPSMVPTSSPSESPSMVPSATPTAQPTESAKPSNMPSFQPSEAPSFTAKQVIISPFKLDIVYNSTSVDTGDIIHHIDSHLTTVFRMNTDESLGFQGLTVHIVEIESRTEMDHRMTLTANSFFRVSSPDDVALSTNLSTLVAQSFTGRGLDFFLDTVHKAGLDIISVTYVPAPSEDDAGRNTTKTIGLALILTGLVALISIATFAFIRWKNSQWDEFSDKDKDGSVDAPTAPGSPAGTSPARAPKGFKRSPFLKFNKLEDDMGAASAPSSSNPDDDDSHHKSEAEGSVNLSADGSTRFGRYTFGENEHSILSDQASRHDRYAFSVGEAVENTTVSGGRADESFHMDDYSLEGIGYDSSVADMSRMEPTHEVRFNPDVSHRTDDGSFVENKPEFENVWKKLSDDKINVLL